MDMDTSDPASFLILAICPCDNISNTKTWGHSFGSPWFFLGRICIFNPKFWMKNGYFQLLDKSLLCHTLLRRGNTPIEQHFALARESPLKVELRFDFPLNSWAGLGWVCKLCKLCKHWLEIWRWPSLVRLVAGGWRGVGPMTHLHLGLAPA